jgi:PAS domain S-box-containing protein
MNALFLDEHRCKCGKLLLKGVFFDGTLEIKCKKCGVINSIGQTKLTDDAAHYLLIVNDHGVITNASDSACQILGYSKDELVGKFFTKIDPTIPVELGKKMFGPELALKNDNHFRLDTIHKSKDGKSIPIIAYFKLHQCPDKGKYLLLSVELKNIPGDRKIDDKNVSKFIDNQCDFYFEVDKNGMGEYMSPSVEKLFGFSQETVIGKNYFDYVPAERRAESKKLFEHFSANKQPYRMIHREGVDANNKTINTDLYFTPKFDEFGKFTGYRVLGWIIKNS